MPPVFAGCLWGTTGLFSRYMDPLGFSPLDMLIVRCGIAALLFGLLILLKDVRLFRIRWKDLWLFLAVGLTGQLMFSYCYYTAIDMMSISTACVLLYTSPAMVMLWPAWCSGNGRLRGGLALLLCVSGSALVSGLGGSATPAGVLYGLGRGLCFAHDQHHHPGPDPGGDTTASPSAFISACWRLGRRSSSSAQRRRYMS